jgi:proline iminopeptidase
MGTAHINGTEIYYDVQGEGPPCLVLHGGLGVDHVLYRTLLPLADRLTLILYDQRGNGRSGRPPLQTLTMKQLADDALVTHLGHERVLVFGHSYGGFVAQELALRHPATVRGLILANTTPGQLGKDEIADGEQGPPPPPEWLELVTHLPETDDALKAAMPQMLRFYLHQTDPAVLGPLLQDTIVDVAAMVRGFELLSGWSSVDRLGSITAPTLVLGARHDLVTSWPQSRRISSRVSGATLHVLEHSGHFPWVDEPEETFAAVRSWLDAHGLVTGASDLR